MTDPIADMLTRIRNASAVKKPEVLIPMSKLKYQIAKLLERGSWVQRVEQIKDSINGKGGGSFDEIKIVLKYRKNGESAISSLKRISRPGLRVYTNKENLPRVLNNLGIAIMSTSAGILTNKEARKKKVGGEIMCEIY